MKKYKIFRHEVEQPLDTDYRLIPLTLYHNAIVSASDFEWLSQWTWCAAWSDRTRSFYATRVALHGKQREQIHMSRLILGLTDNKDEAEHRNQDTLDNRRENLRVATGSQNQGNKKRARNNHSEFKGVSRQGNKWRPRIMIAGKNRSFGMFATLEEAARAYDAAAREHFGDFARTNF